MKQAPRPLSRTTLWRRMKKTTARPSGLGRRLINPAVDEERLAYAASVLQLAREHGRGGFGEHQLKVYPRRPNPPGVAKPYPASKALHDELLASGLPAVLLLLHAIDVCKPQATDLALVHAGKRYVQRLLEPTKSEPKRLLRLALQAVYQYELARGHVPAGKSRPVVTGILEELGLSKRMRSYWSAHPNTKNARELITRLAGSELPRIRPVSAYRLSALAQLIADPAPESEKRVAVTDAVELFRNHPPTQNRMTPLQESHSDGDGYEAIYAALGE